MSRIGSLKYPELIFGIAGPIGINIDEMIRTLRDCLKSVGYVSALVRITEEISSVPSNESYPVNPSYFNVMKYKMAHSSAICRNKKDSAYLMRIAIRAIRRLRSELVAKGHFLDTVDDDEKSVFSHIPEGTISVFDKLLRDDDEISYRSAYVIRQIKRPEEVDFLRSVYGRQFILVSGYGSVSDRMSVLQEQIRHDHNGKLSPAREAFQAASLIEMDAEEEGDSYGQRLRDAFHLADVVVDGINKSQMIADVDRFIKALFGYNSIAPNKDEHGMFAASAASLRSSDLSRQVGAAIFSENGEILAQGCNEVPKAFGGTYWDGENPDFRDVKLGKDSNDILKVDVLTDLIERLKKNGILSDKVIKAGSPAQIVGFLIGRQKVADELKPLWGSLKNARIMDLTEYGRVVHAEMNAICDAARIGTPLRASVLYTTTFPCHNCTKHIIAAGIKQVVFLEPYPKSKAKDLHDNEIVIEELSDDKVAFRFFSGITPQLFRDVFAKNKRKRDGVAVRWQHGGPAPMVNVSSPDYLRLEEVVIEPV